MDELDVGDAADQASERRARLAGRQAVGHRGAVPVVVDLRDSCREVTAVRTHRLDNLVTLMDRGVETPRTSFRDIEVPVGAERQPARVVQPCREDRCRCRLRPRRCAGRNDNQRQRHKHYEELGHSWLLSPTAAGGRSVGCTPRFRKSRQKSQGDLSGGSSGGTVSTNADGARRRAATFKATWFGERTAPAWWKTQSTSSW